MFYGYTAHRTALCFGALGFTATPVLFGVLGPILALFYFYFNFVLNLPFISSKSVFNNTCCLHAVLGRHSYPVDYLFLLILSLKSHHIRHLCKSQFNLTVLKIDFKVPQKKALHIFDDREFQMMITVNVKDSFPKMSTLCFG